MLLTVFSDSTTNLVSCFSNISPLKVVWANTKTNAGGMMHDLFLHI